MPFWVSPSGGISPGGTRPCRATCKRIRYDVRRAPYWAGPVGPLLGSTGGGLSGAMGGEVGPPSFGKTTEGPGISRGPWSVARLGEGDGFAGSSGTLGVVGIGGGSVPNHRCKAHAAAPATARTPPPARNPNQKALNPRLGAPHGDGRLG
jgi:hypothetical protein